MKNSGGREGGKRWTWFVEIDVCLLLIFPSFLFLEFPFLPSTAKLLGDFQYPKFKS
jgi:hypothetical protein